MEAGNFGWNEELSMADRFVDECDFCDDAMMDADENRMERTRAYRRRQRALHIRWKEKFIASRNHYWSYEHRGTLDKGKIHCSCSMCQKKRRSHGMKHSEKKKIAYEDLELITQKSQREHSLTFRARW